MSNGFYELVGLHLIDPSIHTTHPSMTMYSYKFQSNQSDMHYLIDQCVKRKRQVFSIVNLLIH